MKHYCQQSQIIDKNNLPGTLGCDVACDVVVGTDTNDDVMVVMTTGDDVARGDDDGNFPASDVVSRVERSLVVVTWWAVVLVRVVMATAEDDVIYDVTRWGLLVAAADELRTAVVLVARVRLVKGLLRLLTTLDVGCTVVTRWLLEDVTNDVRVVDCDLVTSSDINVDEVSTLCDVIAVRRDVTRLGGVVMLTSNVKGVDCDHTPRVLL